MDRGPRPRPRPAHGRRRRPLRALLARRVGARARQGGRRSRSGHRRADRAGTPRPRPGGQRARPPRALPRPPACARRLAPRLGKLSGRPQAIATALADAGRMSSITALPEPSADLAQPEAPDVEVVVAVLNEQAALAPSIRALHAYLTAKLPFSWRIVIADNGSTHDTPRAPHPPP